MKQSITKILVVIILLTVGVFAASASSADQSIKEAAGEPTLEMAKGWWPPQRSGWTPIGWKDHLFRFSVLYNGMITATPHPRGPKSYTKK